MFEEIIAAHPDESFVAFAGLNGAIIGLDVSQMRLVYSVSSIIEILMELGMTDEEAVGCYEERIEGVDLGEKTPIMCDDTFYSDEYLNN